MIFFLCHRSLREAAEAKLMVTSFKIKLIASETSRVPKCKCLFQRYLSIGGLRIRESKGLSYWHDEEVPIEYFKGFDSRYGNTFNYFVIPKNGRTPGYTFAHENVISDMYPFQEDHCDAHNRINDE